METTELQIIELTIAALDRVRRQNALESRDEWADAVARELSEAQEWVDRNRDAILRITDLIGVSWASVEGHGFTELNQRPYYFVERLGHMLGLEKWVQIRFVRAVLDDVASRLRAESNPGGVVETVARSNSTRANKSRTPEASNRLLAAIMQHPDKSWEEIGESAGMDRSTVFRHLQRDESLRTARENLRKMARERALLEQREAQERRAEGDC